jgi:hypothetical protein
MLQSVCVVFWINQFQINKVLLYVHFNPHIIIFSITTNADLTHTIAYLSLSIT